MNTGIQAEKIIWEKWIAAAREFAKDESSYGSFASATGAACTELVLITESQTNTAPAFNDFLGAMLTTAVETALNSARLAGFEITTAIGESATQWGDSYSAFAIPTGAAEHADRVLLMGEEFPNQFARLVTNMLKRASQEKYIRPREASHLGSAFLSAIKARRRKLGLT